MTAVTYPYRKPVSLKWLIIALVIVACATSLHAWLKKGAAAAAVADSFASDGTCKLGPSLTMRAEAGMRLMICFITEDKVQMHVENSEGGGITDIPAEFMRNPRNYIPNVIKRLGYRVEAIHGELPKWILEIISGGA